MRLPVLVTTAIVALGLFCGHAPAARFVPPTVENPYCAITTYMVFDLPEEAFSSMDSDQHPIIVVSAMTIRQALPYGRFLMAHECCHHTLGHVANYHREFGHLGPQPFLSIAPELKRMELEADCCAVKLLKQNGQLDSIEAARVAMEAFGPQETGAYYPTGNERAANIAACAAEE